MTLRDLRYWLTQAVFWNPVGAVMLRLACGIIRRFEAVALNYNLTPAINGEYWLIDRLPREPAIVVIDVGFHKGDFTASVLERRPDVGLVAAFDPWRPARAFYEQRFAQDGRVRFFAAALAAEAGTAVFHDYGTACNSLAPRTDAGPEEAAYEVPVQTLDAWCEAHGIGHVTLLKIDAEGFDVAVLEGARRLLAAGRVDLILFEYSTAWIAARRYLKDAAELLGRHPYTLHRLWNGFLSPYRYHECDENFGVRACMFVATADRVAWTAGLPRRSYI